MELENYKLQHAYRVYYPNCCNYCFSSENLLKCSSCLSVYYCSKEHQSKDWAFHKPTCTALKEIKNIVPFPKNCDLKKLVSYQKALVNELVKYRGFTNPTFLTEYERQICLFPWVCSVCFKKPSIKYVCVKCLSVTYCSESHQKSDEAHTKVICTFQRLYRLFASLDYENGLKLEPRTYTYHPIKKHIKRWPGKRIELFTLIHQKNLTIISEETLMAANMFLEPYMPAATIINALELAGLIKKRNFVCIKNKHDSSTKTVRSRDANNKSTLNRKYEKKKGEPRTKTTFRIHFAFADEYELSIQWKKVAELLADWIININNVEIVLIGPKLKGREVPSFECGGKLARVVIHGELYKNVEFSTAPDLIVVLEFWRVFDFGGITFLKNLFRFGNVPVILASGQGIITDIDIKHYFNELETLQIPYSNIFTEMRNPIRKWGSGKYPKSKNFYCAVYRRPCE